MVENSQDEQLKEEEDLKRLGSLVIGSIKEAMKGSPSLLPVGQTPLESWRRRLSHGDRLPRGRFFVGKQPGKTVTVIHHEESSYYEENKGAE
ncbi:hypothetical protein ACTG16_23020 [Aeromonas sp. 23P]|uniref:hypothetical protein n=1 Tax=Aeromonas sp. 23P TaxID=3452716 RepID=UPI003F7A52A7|nr:hypothetical protein [Aeromonas veronii]